jgi:hypothetical protein
MLAPPAWRRLRLGRGYGGLPHRDELAGRRARYRQSVAQLAATQVVHVLQVESVQHICSQTAALVPPSVQLWKQEMLMPQVESARQLCVSSQQPLTMHWVQGVPPGSSMQAPASIGVPQWLLWQARPTQHCPVLWQLEPGGRQLSAPQMPLWHTSLQHSAAVVQGKPSRRHWLAPQVPPSQMVLQQSVGWLQPKPSGVHIPKPQVKPWGLQKSVQQSVLAAHESPSGRHMPVPQVPVSLSQALLQHCAPTMQPAPWGKHMLAPQVPSALQTEVQHWASSLQSSPSERQVTQTSWKGSHAPVQHWVLSLHEEPSCSQLELHTAALHTPSQQSLSAVHELPSGKHMLAPQVPAEHCSVQHWLAAEQDEPSDRHCWKAHSPFSGLQMPLQHPPGPPHGAPLGWQVVCPHTPAVQAPVQHCVAESQRKPSGWQVLPQKPPVQGRLQQSLSMTHAAPCGLHMPLPQKPSVAHESSQQSSLLVQAAPSGAHCSPPQKPAIQMTPLQHALTAVQASPLGVHWTPPQKPWLQSSAQQSVVRRQASPSASHRWSFAHAPLASQVRPEQQSAPVEQAWPDA